MEHLAGWKRMGDKIDQWSFKSAAHTLAPQKLSHYEWWTSANGMPTKIGPSAVRIANQCAVGEEN